MRLTSRWIRVLFSVLALGVIVGSVVQFSNHEPVQLLAEDSSKGGGG